MNAKKLAGRVMAYHAVSMTDITFDPLSLIPLDISGILADLRRLCDERGWDYAALDRQGYEQYLLRRQIERSDEQKGVA